ncbi:MULTISPECIES: hypothetical protein [unclassified Nitratiruptor]|uniref:hypothetical protein n=1 Tax=unclassified Nitratiruptor TaxID=2624044 RepID=UPI0019165640|nr:MULTISPECIES: hypothetical protein [unclassified Nitratiruptor]BCD60881.1 hypothetical protein NitYY0810_C1659 [Nitratiruptor sp. YY08-10]BCD64813.1 hypothetical protein NitYY0814_C1667 [Nitratiruptor sp. YY08-14]
MDQLFTMSKHLHMTTVFLLIVAQIAFFWIAKEDDFISFVRRVKKLYLVQTVLFAMVVFTGLLMLTVLKFSVWNVEIVLMIFVSIAILVHQILLYKKLRPIRSDETGLQNAYKTWAKKVMGAEILAEIVVFVLAVILK